MLIKIQQNTDAPQFTIVLHPDKHIMRWKCDVKNAFNTIPLHFSGFPSWSCGWLGAGTHCLCPTSLTEYCTTYSWPRKKNQNSKKYGSYWMHVAFAPLQSWKTLSRTIVSEGPPVLAGERRCPRHLLPSPYTQPCWVYNYTAPSLQAPSDWCLCV